ncbi:hypothetical protein [Salinispora vitiensis]|uniref:hypothetical protein n=1 Tax=Salinispora vitiensis TaxID=999544 RepID=UPI00035DBB65|nr:hypothetical protein [Salinispora vitiensis]
MASVQKLEEAAPTVGPPDETVPIEARDLRVRYGQQDVLAGVVVERPEVLTEAAASCEGTRA